MSDTKLVEGVVKRVEHYGLYFDSPLGEVIVLIPDVSESEGPVSLQDVYNVGDKERIRIIRYDEKTGLYKGSMKDLEPEDPSSAE